MRASRLGGGLALFVLLLTASLGQAATLIADDVPPGKTPVETVAHADLVGIANPEGFSLVVGAYRRWVSEFDRVEAIPSSYLQAGTMLGINPAYAQGSVYGEWMPALFAQVRLQYDLYGYFGTNGALLSFPSATAPFGDDEVKALKGQEESTIGQRLFFQPTLRGKLGPLYLRNQTDLAAYWFDGRGPYFYEWEYDTLLKSGDALIANRTHALFEAWKGKDNEILLMGPFYEVVYARGAELTRQRLGAAFYWVPMERVWSLSRPRFYAEIGYNLQDRNRDNQAFAVFGIGFDYDLLK
jgi:hypothetical protein